VTGRLVRGHPIIDEVLEANRAAIGPLYAAWPTHSYRMLNICMAACPEEPVEKFAVAIAFHDLPAAIDGDLRYLDRATALARTWLVEHGLGEWVPEVSAMIFNHHKIRPYRGPHAPTVDAFRRADRSDGAVERRPGQGSGRADQPRVSRGRTAPSAPTHPGALCPAPPAQAVPDAALVVAPSQVPEIQPVLAQPGRHRGAQTTRRKETDPLVNARGRDTHRTGVRGILGRRQNRWADTARRP
jgi:hypothetical protein